MQIKTKHLLTMLVMAGITSAALPGHAATTFAAGDLLLGFRSGTDTTTTLVVNVTAGTFTNAAAVRDANGNTGTVMTNIATALSNTFGSTWATQTDLSWGVVGVYDNSAFGSVVDGDPARTLYVSRPNTTGAIGAKSSTTPTVSGDTAMSTIANNIAGFQQSFATYGGTTENGGAAATIATSVPNSWDEYTTVTNDFGLTGSIEGSAGTTNGRVLDLYRILADTTGATPPGTLRSGSWEGTISLGTNGDVTFTSTNAVPEPSRAVLALGGMAVLFMRRRRRSV